MNPWNMLGIARRFSASVLVPALVVLSHAAPAAGGPTADGAGDATVVAVIDIGLVPYHWDFVADKMPQALNDDPSDDLPLDRAPHEWLPAFPRPDQFRSYNPLELELETQADNAPLQMLIERDRPRWEKLKPSTSKKINYYWIPDTKVVGVVDFAGTRVLGTSSSHGLGTTSVSVGNIHGTCPECLLVFISLGSRQQGEAAIEWAMQQPWIDAITNSYGFSLLVRDRVYSGSDVKLQRRASERGQTIFFSAGNGQEGAFIAPNTTYFSSQEGPDWIVTVGAVSPGDGNYYPSTPSTSNHASYSGHGKPADIASIGSRYPSAYTAATVSGTGSSGFGGTSNATPTVAGMYSRALYEVRRALPGASRVQDDGVVATGRPVACGGRRPDCELGDGALTAKELRRRLFHGAIHTSAGMTAAGYGELAPLGEDEFLNEGHGSYFAREAGPENPSVWKEEMDRIVGPMFGTASTIERPDGEKEWMVVDSFCRQHLWGDWSGGYYVEGRTDLPGNDPRYPLRSRMEEICPFLTPPP